MASGATRAPFGVAYVAPVRARHLIDSARGTAEAEDRRTSGNPIYPAQYRAICGPTQVAGYKRVQTPQIADIRLHSGGALSLTQAPQIAEVTDIPAKTEGALSPSQPAEAAPFLPPPVIPEAVQGAQRTMVTEPLVVADLITPVDHAARLQALLAAIQVKPNEDLPFCWWRAEQTCAMQALCSDTELTVEQTSAKFRGTGPCIGRQALRIHFRRTRPRRSARNRAG